MLHDNTKSLLDSVSKIMSETKVKFEQEQRDLEEAQKALWEKKMGKKPLHPNQQKIDVVDDEKIDGKDFAKLRAMKNEEKTVQEAKKNKDTPGQHQCAVHVKNEEWGAGRTIHSQHAEPDAEGNIAWYDVMFEHGIEKRVPVEQLEILVSESHMDHKKKAKK